MKTMTTKFEGNMQCNVVHIHTSFGSLSFIWMIEDEVDQIQVSQVVVYVSREMPIFASRDVRQTLIHKYNHLTEYTVSYLCFPHGRSVNSTVRSVCTYVVYMCVYCAFT